MSIEQTAAFYQERSERLRIAPSDIPPIIGGGAISLLTSEEGFVRLAEPEQGGGQTLATNYGEILGQARTYLNAVAGAYQRNGRIFREAGPVNLNHQYELSSLLVDPKRKIGGRRFLTGTIHDIRIFAVTPADISNAMAESPLGKSPDPPQDRIDLAVFFGVTGVLKAGSSIREVACLTAAYRHHSYARYTGVSVSEVYREKLTKEMRLRTKQ